MELEKKSPRGLNCVRVTAADSRAETPLAIPPFRGLSFAILFIP
jgi:hypothetical protein